MVCTRLYSALLLGLIVAPVLFLAGCPSDPTPPLQDEEGKETKEWNGLAENPFATYADGFYGNARHAETTQTLYSPVLMRAADCSLNLIYGAQDSNNSGAIETVQQPYFSTYLHYAAQLTGSFSHYTGGCGDRPAGTEARDAVYLGRTTSGGWTAAFIDPNNNLDIYDVAALGSFSERVAPLSPYVVVTAASAYGTGRLDLFALDYGNGGSDPGGIDLFKNNGDGTFGSPVRIVISGSTSSTRAGVMALADFNKDGKPDLLVLMGDGSLELHLGQGNGSFASPVTIGSSSNGMGLADLNGDGFPDIIEGSTVLLSNGSGGYTTVTSSGLPNTGTMAFGNFHTGGKVDAAVLNNGQVTIYAGNGKGQFTAGKSYLVSAGSTYLNAADIDGDGNVDIVVGEGNDGVYGYTTNMRYSVQFLMGHGDGSFADAPYYAIGNNTLAAGAFTTGGHVDVLTGGVSGAEGIATPGLTVLKNDGSGNLTPQATLNGPSPWSIATADMDGDGNLDAVWLDGTDPSPTFRIGVALGNGDGTFKSPAYYSLPNATAPAESFGMVVTTATVVTGGKPDVFVTFSGGSYRLPNNGKGVLGTAVSFNGTDPVFADLNGDNKLDMVSIGSNGIMVSLGNGDGTFKSPVSYLSGSTVALLAIGDFTHDGKLDIAAQINTGTPPAASISVLPGNGSGGFGSPVTTQLSLSQFRNMASADVDGDGYPDLAMVGSTGTSIEISEAGGAFEDNMLPLPVFSYGLALAPVYGGTLPDMVLGSARISSALGVAQGVSTIQNLHGVRGIDPGGTTTSLAASPATIKTGGTVKLTATVSAKSGGIVPGGTIKFFYGSTLLGTAVLNGSGVATFTASASGVPQGSYAVQAFYTGAQTFMGSASTAETVTVSNAAATTTAVTASPNPATIGNTVTLTATVKSASGTPEGSVQFVSEGAVLGSSTLSGGVAKLSASSAGLPAGNYGVTAKYLGNTSYAASQGAVTVTLKQ